MFEEGAELKPRLGADQVFDLTLGNPVLEPPLRFLAAGAGGRRPAPRSPPLHAQRGRLDHPPGRGGILTRPDLPYGAQVVIVSGASGGLNMSSRPCWTRGMKWCSWPPISPNTCSTRQPRRVAGVVQTDEHFRPDLGRLEAALIPRAPARFWSMPPTTPRARLRRRDVERRLRHFLISPCRAPQAQPVVPTNPAGTWSITGPRFPASLQPTPTPCWPPRSQRTCPSQGSASGMWRFDPGPAGRGELEGASCWPTACWGLWTPRP